MNNSTPTLAPTSTPNPLQRTIIISLVVVTLLTFVLALVNVLDPVWWQVIFLGIVEGVTEFLPISSTAHLLITAQLIGFQHSMGGTFEIFIQLGAILAVIGYYARDLLAQARRLTTDAGTRRFWLCILIAFLPAAIVGLLLRKWIKTVLFASPALIAWAFIIGGIILILIEYWPPRVKTHDAEQSSLGQALVVGIAQVVALVPGASRSGASIVGGMLAGLDRRAATTFSFYLAIPTLGAATLVDLLGSLKDLAPHDGVYLLLGLVVSLIVAWLSIDWLLRFVAHHTLIGFGVYRIIVGILILALLFAGLLH